MMNKKIIMILTFILILSISSASASADFAEGDGAIMGLDDSNQASVDSSQIETDSNQATTDSSLDKKDNSIKILKDNNTETASFMELSNLLSNSSGDTIYLENDYRYDNATDAGLINGIELKSISIDGKNHSIDGNAKSRIFNIVGDGVILKNIVFLNGYSEAEGGAIFSDNRTVNLTGCRFQDNYAKIGGALYANGSSYIEDVEFINNSASSKGGAAFVSNMTVVKDCIFDGNHADDGASLYIRDLPNPLADSSREEDYNYTSDDIYGNYSDDMPDNDTDDYFDWDSLDNDTDDEDLPVDSDEETFDYDPVEDFTARIVNSVFINSEDFVRGALFAGHFNNVEVDGCIFENMSSQYAPAIYTGYGVNILLNNSRFADMQADKTGGAIAIMEDNQGIIVNSTFINLHSSKNGGAIYYDANGWGHCAPVYIAVMNSSFINCSSDYGGAILSLGGGFRIKNVKFINNSASYSGGAAYLNTDYGSKIYDSSFEGNRLNHSSDEGLSFGGALFIDDTKDVKINNSRFMNNSNNAIYCYDVGLKLNNSLFENNGEAIYSVYRVKALNLGENEFNGDKIVDLDEDPFFELIRTGEGLKLDLINNTIDTDSIPSYFLADDWGWMTPFKDQDFSGGCWCFSTCAAIEAALLKATGVAYDFSEQNMQKMLSEYSKYGNNYVVEAGQTDVALLYAISWLGVFPEEYDTFDMIGKITRLIDTNETIHVQDAPISYAGKELYSADEIKRMVLKYGTVTADFYAVYEEPNFNAKTSAFYCDVDDGRDATHAVALVGWDDSYSADNFIVTPPGDGAWIIKNSYGPYNYDGGYVYVSYYDTVIKYSPSVAYLFENTENYTKNYQTDLGGQINILNKSSVVSYMNSYQSIGDDYISAVGTFFSDPDEEYIVGIYVNGELKTSQSGKSPFRGYHTIKLDKQVPIKTGDNFTAMIKTYSIPVLNTTRLHFKENTSFADNGSGWTDLSTLNLTATLKVYTMASLRESAGKLANTIIEYKDMTTTAVAKADGRTGKYFTVTLKDENGTALANKEVKIGFNGRVYNKTTDENGSAKLQINLGYKGTYTFAIGFLGDNDYYGAFEVAKITVKVQTPKLTASNKSYKASAKTKSLTATFKTANGKLVSGKKITFTVNGKTYTAKTNAKGVATVNVSINKKGTYSFTAKAAGDYTFATVSKKGKLTIK